MTGRKKNKMACRYVQKPIHAYLNIYVKFMHGVDHVSKGRMLAEVNRHWFTKGLSNYPKCVFSVVLLFLLLSNVIYARKTVYCILKVKRSKMLI